MIPKVVIIGRPNVGKSSLLNMLAGRRISIVDPTAGVTRDRITATAELPSPHLDQPARFVELIDTGGYGVEDVQDLTADIERQIARGVAEAHLILFVVDAQSGVVPLDQEVARLLRRGMGGQGQQTTGDLTKKVLVVANKVDGPRHEAAAYDAGQFGLGEPIPVSALSGHNKAALIEAIYERLDFEAIEAQEPPPDPGVLVAIVGKRNAGKSTLVNALAGDQRVIVSEQEGTTRDSIDVRLEIGDRVFTAIDTAGLRRTKSLAGDIEFYSQHRTLRSLRRADVVLFLLDATVPVSQVDQHLEEEVLKHHKPCVIVVNKWDLAQGQSTQEAYLEYLEKTLKGLDFAPIAFISAQKGEGLRELLAMAYNLHQQASHRVPTAELNRVVHQVIAERAPSSPHGHHPKVYYVTQPAIQPPTIALFVNDPTMFTPTYKKFLLNRFRELLPFAEVPIKLFVRGKPKEGEEQR